jgi:hypothetical protein
MKPLPNVQLPAFHPLAYWWHTTEQRYHWLAEATTGNADFTLLQWSEPPPVTFGPKSTLVLFGLVGALTDSPLNVSAAFQIQAIYTIDQFFAFKTELIGADAGSGADSASSYAARFHDLGTGQPTIRVRGNASYDVKWKARVFGVEVFPS